MSDSTNPFAGLGLRAEIVETLTALGYEVPTPIQERTIPLMLAARDLIGQAQTGTGKTAAFALPILEKIDPKLRDTQVLVLTPTRELAMQVADAIHSYAVKLGPISKRGNGYLRRLLVNGAMSVLGSKRARQNPWIAKLLASKPRKLAAVAVANKLARIGWAVMMCQEDFRTQPAAA